MWLDHCVIFKNQTTTCLHQEATVLLSSYKRMVIITVEKGYLKLFNLERWSTGWISWGPKNTVILLLKEYKLKAYEREKKLVLGLYRVSQKSTQV